MGQYIIIVYADVIARPNMQYKMAARGSGHGLRQTKEDVAI